MKREAEPELMITREQVIAYANADFSQGEKDFIEFIKNYLKVNKIRLSDNDLIIDLGCGPGNISERLSNEWPDVNVIGIDGSREMIKEAESRRNLKRKLKRKKFIKLKYICDDIKNLNLEQFGSKQKISLIVSNSFIHHLTCIDQFFKCILDLSSNETLNFHKDLKRPFNEKEAFALKLKSSQKYNEVLTNDYYASLLASYTAIEIKNQILKNSLTSMDVIEEGEQYLIVYGKV